MPRGMFKSKTLRKVYRKTPGNKVVIHFKKKKPGKAKCAGCGALLKGIPRERPHKMRKMAKTKKKTSRPYGGYFCSRCMRKLIIEKSRI